MAGSDLVIRAQNLGKRYTLQHAAPERYLALRDVIARQASRAMAWVNPLALAGARRFRCPQAGDGLAAAAEDFWALKDVNFEIRRGDRVGFIGRNGAGKSTLLKILSRITEPSAGRVDLRGRVASLLEVGTGFHPELTGRENIFLNGAILGMSQRDIRARFDEIVDFAEVEQFLDTPVKRYSSGMYVRLAFAVAAHLEPDILVVDEVLAVGDLQFQQKCLGKMKSLSAQERTLLFVSHNMGALRALCDSCIVLSHGSIQYQGPVDAGIEFFLNRLDGTSVRRAKAHAPSPQQPLVLLDAWVAAPSGTKLEAVSSGMELVFHFAYAALHELHGLRMVLTIYNSLAEPLTSLSTDCCSSFAPRTGLRGVITCRISRLPLPPGRYRLAAALFDGGCKLYAESEALELLVADSLFFASASQPNPQYCKFYLEHDWDHALIAAESVLR